MYTGVLAVKWYRARRYLSVNWGYQYSSREMTPVQKLLAVILRVPVSRYENGTGPEAISW